MVLSPAHVSACREAAARDGRGVREVVSHWVEKDIFAIGVGRPEDVNERSIRSGRRALGARYPELV